MKLDRGQIRFLTDRVLIPTQTQTKCRQELAIPTPTQTPGHCRQEEAIMGLTGSNGPEEFFGGIRNKSYVRPKIGYTSNVRTRLEDISRECGTKR